MKAVLLLSLYFIFFRAMAWSSVRNPFELVTTPRKIHSVSDCMHVSTEDGDFIYQKSPRQLEQSNHNLNPELVEVETPMTVCGIYLVTDPDKIIEISIKQMSVSCEQGGLLAFVDGWELNGQYFPGEKEHHLKLDNRVEEFCNKESNWPLRPYRRIFRSSQNAALFQYRIPIRGSFRIKVRFLINPTPCNIMVEGINQLYTLKNVYGRSNCTLTALFPAVVSIKSMKVGNYFQEEKNYDCEQSDRLEIGGSAGLDSHNMEVTSKICGLSNHQGPEQSLFCGVTTVRLFSSGEYNNEAEIAIRTADETNIDIATLICEI